MSNKFNIGNIEVGDNLDPYIIAEIGVNHQGSMAIAKRLIDDAKEGGAHAAKFQSYKAEKLASKNSPAYWDQKKESTDSQYKLFQKYDGFGQKEYEELADYCCSLGIHFLSTPFDLEAVAYLAPLVPAFKIASADITNIPLLRSCAQHGKPLIISTGAATLPEIEFAINIARNAGARNISLLHCVLNYPTAEENAQLGMIITLKRLFPEVIVGYSDHVIPDQTISALESAMLLGACILEKHFTYDKTLEGNDHYHAMDKYDLKAFVAKSNKYRKLISTESKDISVEASARKNARRSIVANHDIEKGEIITESMLIAKRPGYGISPVHWDEIIGKTARKNIKSDEILHWNDFL